MSKTQSEFKAIGLFAIILVSLAAFYLSLPDSDVITGSVTYESSCYQGVYNSYCGDDSSRVYICIDGRVYSIGCGMERSCWQAVKKSGRTIASCR